MTEKLPTAEIRPGHRYSAAWLIPLLALVLAGWLGYRAWSLRGLVITVQLEEGHGLEPGDEVRFRGITVGEVREVELDADLRTVLVTASLHDRAGSLARGGSRFWVVRPRLGMTGIEGLETLVGPRYLEALPGAGQRRRHFVGLPGPPIVERIEPGDLEIVLEAATRGPLRAGAPVTYRQFRVGTILSVGLASDAGAIEARLHVEKAYAHLVRPESRFWPIGGARARVGLKGLDVEIDSLQTLVMGGVALATPPGDTPVTVVHTGHRFRLDDEPEDEWLEWQPMAVIGSELLPAGAVRPAPLRATVGWKSGWIFKGRKSVQGWVLPTDRGLLGPADLLDPDAGDDPEALLLEVGGREHQLGELTLTGAGPLAFVAIEIEGHQWPMSNARRMDAAEDCLVVADPAAAPLPLAAARLAPDGDAWTVDPAVSVDPSWHGACVLSREDGALVGLLLVGEDDVRVGLIGK